MNFIIRNTVRLIFVCSVLFFASNATAQDAKDRTIFDVLNYDEVVEVELKTDLSNLIAQKNTNDYQKARLIFEDEAGKEISMDFKIRVRGRFRRKMCGMPPIKFNFDKDDLEDMGLRKDDELKLVTHCVDGPEGKNFLLREYLAYKLYNIITPVSFRVQLLKVTYFDTSTGEKMKMYGVLMEDENTVAHRFTSKDCDDCFSMPKDTFNIENLQHFSLFQYMISNVDWSLDMCRNLIFLLPKKDTKEVLAVPYDFDFSGFVNTTYAMPNPDYNQVDIRQRIFIGPFEKQEELAKGIAHYKDKKQALLDCINDFKLLSRESRKDIESFVLSFYDRIDEGTIMEKPIELPSATGRVDDKGEDRD